MLSLVSPPLDCDTGHCICGKPSGIYSESLLLTQNIPHGPLRQTLCIKLFVFDRFFYGAVRTTSHQTYSSSLAFAASVWVTGYMQARVWVLAFAECKRKLKNDLTQISIQTQKTSF